MTSCLACGSPTKKTHSNSAKFCNNACQGNHRLQERDRLIEAGESVGARRMKAYLVEKHGNVCLDPDCVWDFTTRPLNVELEHMDGDSTNNTLSNCTLICPNCHTFTPTYKNKNKGKGRHERMARYHAGKSY